LLSRWALLALLALLALSRWRGPAAPLAQAGRLLR